MNRHVVDAVGDMGSAKHRDSAICTSPLPQPAHMRYDGMVLSGVMYYDLLGWCEVLKLDVVFREMKLYGMV